MEAKGLIAKGLTCLLYTKAPKKSSHKRNLVGVPPPPTAEGSHVKRTERLPELLAPAGGEESLYAAIAAGADAVYLGGLHSARAHAQNFDEEGLAAAVRYAHLHGVRVYVALNTLLYDRELSAVIPYAERLAAMGVDAAIVADLGLMATLARHLPALPLHASTQAFIHSSATADFYASLGALRVVAARELSLDAINRMTDTCRPEVEVFLHGALCVSHSGQCLFSSLVGGRSGNRGECAQPCRLPYSGGYPLSLRDLSLAAHIPALIASGVSSLKIEGRMKSPTYVAGVTAIYRRLLDEGRAATREEERELSALFSRSGFTDGYFTGRHTSPMTGTRTEENKAESREREENFTQKTVSVRGSVEIRADRPSTLTLSSLHRTVTVTGDTPAPAKSAPLTEDEVTARLGRLGGTPFTLAEGALTVSLGDGLFMTAGQLNALRRAAVDALLETGRAFPPSPYRQREAPSPIPTPKRVAVAYTAEAAKAAAAAGDFFGRVYLALAAIDETAACHEGVVMPPVITDAEWPEVERLLATAAARGVRYAMVENYGQIEAVHRAGMRPVGGFRLNVTNRETAATLCDLGISDFILSPELTAPQIAGVGGRVIAYGRIPLMLTERCFTREVADCRACGRAVLTDRRGVTFPMMREYPHRNLILNSLPTYLADRPAILREAASPAEVYLFTIENEKETAAVIRAARSGQALPYPTRRLPR